MRKINFIKNRLFITILTLFIGLTTHKAHASHIIGGELIYDCLGGNSYRITLKVYRDCNVGTAAYDNPVYISIFDGTASHGFIDTFTIALPPTTILPIVSSDPCFIPPTGICVEEAIYTTVVNLPFSPSGYVFAYQRCCRNNSIINIPSPGATGTTYTETVPLTDLCNNSPRYKNFPPIALCRNQLLVFDHSATDPDGDSLAYYICSPYNGAVSGDPQPMIASTPPFTSIGFIPPFTALNPITGAPSLNIDPISGILTINPTQLGQFVVGICCDEFRNGVKIGTHTRDFQFNVTDCPPSPTPQFSSWTIEGGILTYDSVFVEGCEQGVFIFNREVDTVNLVIDITKGGNALEGIDYDPIPNNLVLPIGVNSDTVFVNALEDGINETTDTIVLTWTYFSPCDSSTHSVSRNLYIEDYTPMVVTMLGDTVICPGGPPPVLEPSVTGGYGSYHYTWYPTSDTTDTLQAILGQTTIFYVNIEDDCNKIVSSQPVTIVKQCPIIIPNVITANSDGTNDVFIIQNIGDYPENEVWFFDRWGVQLHYAKYYQNDWEPKVTDGVYYYVVDDKVNEPWRGFFTVFENP